ncbi:MAG: hypothetical protein ACRDR6_28065 [Pseudonocardiaceae bacterium]
MEDDAARFVEDDPVSITHILRLERVGQQCDELGGVFLLWRPDVVTSLMRPTSRNG